MQYGETLGDTPLKLHFMQSMSFAVCIGMTASVLALAQAPPQIIKIIREEVRTGHDASHEVTEAGYVKALSKAGYANYVGMTALAGPREAWFMEYYPSYAAVEAARALGSKEPAKSELDQLDVKDAESVSGSRTLLAVYQKDLSFMPERPRPKSHFIAVQIVRVRMGRDADYARIRSMANEARAAAGTKGRQLVYRVSSGAPTGTYVLLRGMESMKDLDPDPSVRTLSDVMGAEKWAAFQKLLGEVEVSSETMLFAVNPVMSYPTKDAVDADPSFWSQPPATAAGPKKKK
jgi:hypothetical protein